MKRSFWLVALALVVVAPMARAEDVVSGARSQMWLFLAPEEHSCAGPVSTWHDPSDAAFFAKGPTARLDAQELWAGGLPTFSLAGARYDTGVLRLVVLGVASRTKIELGRSGIRSRWPFC
jgi:hypothetical protein